jgi:ABC-type nickel/cobalt efflux system permease component RcnA
VNEPARARPSGVEELRLQSDITALCALAASIGFLHTAFGPDHYVPFIVMARVRRWSLAKTAWITFLCGLGHVLSSVVLGLVGVALGVAVMKLEVVEGYRGSVAAWLLIGFGFAYFVWGVHRAARNRPHRHKHSHGIGATHDHVHTHEANHVHVHEDGKQDVTPWILFTLFVFGPCEPLIPILMYPAAESSAAGMILVASVFSVVTIGTMLTVVLLGAWGVGFARLERWDRFSHAAAGMAIFACGLAIEFLGL